MPSKPIMSIVLMAILISHTQEVFAHGAEGLVLGSIYIGTFVGALVGLYSGAMEKDFDYVFWKIVAGLCILGVIFGFIQYTLISIVLGPIFVLLAGFLPEMIVCAVFYYLGKYLLRGLRGKLSRESKNDVN